MSPVHQRLRPFAVLSIAILLTTGGLVVADETIDPDEPETIRLGGGAAATGWLGRMPRDRKKTLLKPIKRSVTPALPDLAPPPEPGTPTHRPSTRGLTLKQSAASSPPQKKKPQAAPTRVIPSPEPTRAAGPTDVAPLKRRPQSNTLPPASIPATPEAPAVPEALDLPAAPAAPTTLTKPFAAPTPARQISRSTVTMLPPADEAEVLIAPPVEPTAADSDESVPPVSTDGEDAPDAEDDELTASVSELFRPLRTMTLATPLETQRGADGSLRVPEDRASAIFDQFGVVYDLPTLVADGTVWKCDYPIFYNPLYFEDPNMERCGIGHGCFTEAASLVRFFGRIPIVPYLVGSNPPHTCVRSLGTCELCHSYGFHAYVPPINVPGVAAQALATVGLVFMLP